MKFANGVPDDLEQNLAMIDELGGTKTYNHYPTGWAMAFNTPFKMWKRYEFNGGHQRPVHRLVAGRHEGSRRDPRPVLPRDRPRPDDPGRARRRGAGDDQGPHADALRRRQHARQLRRRQSRVEAEDAVLRDARLALDLARGLEGRHDAPEHRRLGQLQRRRVGALPRRRRPLRGEQPRGGAAGQAPRDGQHLVLGGGRGTARSRSTTARRSRS